MQIGSSFSSGDFVEKSTTIDINGVVQDLSTSRTWTIFVPTKTSELTNDSGFITTTDLSTYLTITSAAATYQPIGSYLTSISGLNISQLTNDSGYITSTSLSPYLTSASAAATYQPILVSGTNIKTVNGTSILGAGDITISGAPVLSAGSIPFSNGTTLIEDNTNFIYDNVNKRLRLGKGGFAPNARGLLDVSTNEDAILAQFESRANISRVFIASNIISAISFGTLTSSQWGIGNKGSISNAFVISTDGSLSNTLYALRIEKANGNIGLSLPSNAAATATLHLRAGTASAGSAPIKLTPQTNLLAVPENGTFETDATNLYFTIGGVRKIVNLM